MSEQILQTFADIDIDPTRFGYTPETPITRVGEGKNSTAFEARGEIIKLTKADTRSVEAYELAQEMHIEYAEMAAYIGDFLAPTNYHVVYCDPEGKRAKVATIQKRIKGVSIAGYLQSPEGDPEQLINFYNRCLELHKDTGLIPDIAGSEHRFDALKNGNVLVGVPDWDSESQFVAQSYREDSTARAILVDTNLARPQRMRGLGSVWSRAIAWGVKKAVNELSDM